MIEEDNRIETIAIICVARMADRQMATIAEDGTMMLTDIIMTVGETEMVTIIVTTSTAESSAIISHNVEIFTTATLAISIAIIMAIMIMDIIKTLHFQESQVHLLLILRQEDQQSIVDIEIFTTATLAISIAIIMAIMIMDIIKTLHFQESQVHLLLILRQEDQQSIADMTIPQ